MKPLLTLNKFLGIAQSPQEGFDEVLNCDVDEENVIKASLKYHQDVYNNVSAAFTADAGTNIITHASLVDSANGLNGNDIRAVTFTNSGGALPAGLSAATTYWLIRVSNTTSKVATTWQNALAGTAIDITDAGTGTHTIVSFSMASIIQITRDPSSGRYFAISSNGQVWVQNSNQVGWEYIYSQASGVGLGIAALRNYLLVFGERYVDGIGPLSSARTSWVTTANFLDTGKTQTVRDVILGHGTTGENVWFTNSPSANVYTIGSVRQAAGQVFDPASSTTYDFDASAFTLIAVPYCLTEQGDNLCIGTNNGIYIWDKFSGTADLPLLNGKTVSSIALGENNLLIALVGESTTETLSLYGSDGTSATLLVKIPPRIATAGYGMPRGTMVIKDKVYFLLAGTSNIYNSNVYNGLWAYNLKTGKLVLENVSISGSYSTIPYCIYGVGSTVSKPLYFASGNILNAIASILYQHTYLKLYNNYESYFTSALYALATNFNKKMVMSADFVFDRPLASGDEVRISYRKSSQASYTSLGSVTFTANGAVSSANFPLGGIETDIIQFKFEIKTSDPGAGNRITGPTIKDIVIS